jgi:hypothetical protein
MLSCKMSVTTWKHIVLARPKHPRSCRYSTGHPRYDIGRTSKTYALIERGAKSTSASAPRPAIAAGAGASASGVPPHHQPTRPGPPGAAREPHKAPHSRYRSHPWVLGTSGGGVEATSWIDKNLASRGRRGRRWRRRGPGRWLGCGWWRRRPRHPCRRRRKHLQRTHSHRAVRVCQEGCLGVVSGWNGRQKPGSRGGAHHKSRRGGRIDHGS